MLTYLPWISLVIALLAIVARDGGVEKGASKTREAPAGAFLMLAILVGVAILGGLTFNSRLEGLQPATMGFAIGALTAAVAYWLGLMAIQTNAGRAAPIALAAAAASFTNWMFPDGMMTLVFGAASAAWLLSIGKAQEPNPWAMRSAVAAAVIVAVNSLGQQLNMGARPAQTGVILALAAAVAIIIGGFVGSKTTKSSTATSPVSLLLGYALFAGVCYLLQWKYFQFEWVGILPLVGGFIGLVVNWLLPADAAPNTVRLCLAAVIWVALGTAAFAFLKGFGMSVALLGGIVVVLMANNPRALLSMGPFAALVFYRVFREEHLEASRALDIGQHYAIIGILLGALLPVMAQEWLRGTAKKGGFMALLAGVLWIAVLAVTPIAVAILLSARGVIGYVVGLGIGSVIEGIRGERSAHSLSVALGLSALMTLFYDWLVPYTQLDRNSKVSLLIWIGGGLLVAAIVIAVLSGDTSVEEEKATTTS